MGFRIVGEFVEPTQTSQPLGDRNSLVEALLPAVRQVESSGGVNLLGPVLKNGDRAKGPFQFLDSTAADVASQLGMTKYNIFDDKDAEPMARHYLGTLYDRYEDPKLALAAYNYGMGNIDKRLKTAKERSFEAIAETLPKETRNYVPKVMGLVGDALVPSVQAEEPSQVAKPKYRVVGEEMPTPKYKIVGEDVPTEAPQTQSWGDYGMDIARQLGQGATFNFGDEIGLIDKAKADQFEKDHPYQSMGAQMAGGLAGPLIAALMAPVAPAAGAGALAAGAGRLALGAGFKQAAKTGVGRIGQGVVAGAVPSAINAAGDSEGGLTERALNAMAGGAIGGTLGGAIGIGAEGIRRGVGKLAPEIKSLAGRLTGYGDDELATAGKALRSAKADDSPTFLVEALDNPEFTREAKAIASKKDTYKIADDILKARQAGQYDRISDIADVVSPVRSADEATNLVVNKARARQEGLIQAREDKSFPLFEQAYRETPTVQGIDDLLSVPSIKKAISTGTKDVDTVNLPENSTKLLNSVAAKLGDEVGALKKAGEFQMARDRMGTRVALKNVLDQIKPLKMANEEYANLSVPINKLKKAGFDKILKDEFGETVAKEGFTASQLGQQLLSERTKIADVRKLKEAFGGDDEPIKAAVRSHIQDLFDRKIDGYDISNVLNTPKFKKKLNVLVGEKDAGRLLTKLEREIKISKTNKALRVGSDTAPNLEGAIGEDIKRIGKIASTLKYPTRMAGEAVDYLSGAIGKKSPKVYQDEARIIFSRDPAQDALNSILGSRTAKGNYDARIQYLMPLINALSRAGFNAMPSDGE